MAIVNYLSVDFTVSPRIIWIDTTASTSINVQNLIDTCMHISALAANMDDAILLESSGKEYLVADGSVKVGLTVTLNNAKIAFRSLGGPLWILCSIEGGNVVAVEDIYTDPRVYIPVIYPTPFISVERVSSSSATLSELSAIQYGSYGGGVTIDVINGTAGTAFPIGTIETPSNNLADTMSIATERGFNVIYIKGDLTVDSGSDYTGMTFEGESQIKTEINVNSAANVLDCEFYNAYVTGTLDGNCVLMDCRIDELNYIHGVIERCSIDPGVIKLGGTEDALFLDCWAGGREIGVNKVIDCGGSGQGLALRNYNGGIVIKNKTGPEHISIDLNSGRVGLDSSSVIAGTITVRGVGELFDYNTGENIFTGIWNGGVTIDNNAISNRIISQEVWDEPISDHVIANTTGHEIYHQAYQHTVYINTVTGQSGTIHPYGTREIPVNNLADALVIAAEHKFPTLHIEGSLTVSGGEDISGYTVIADRSLNNEVIVTDGTTSETYFTDLTVSGTMNGSVRYTTCVLGAINNFDGGAKNCLLTGNITITGTGANYLTDCDTYVTDASYKQIDVGDKLLNIIKCRGNYELVNYTGASAVTVDLVSGHLKVASSCVSGIITVAGLVNLVDESGAGCNVIDATLTEAGTADAVADEDIIKSIDKKTKLIPGLF